PTTGSAGGTSSPRHWRAVERRPPLPTEKSHRSVRCGLLAILCREDIVPMPRRLDRGPTGANAEVTYPLAPPELTPGSSLPWTGTIGHGFRSMATLALSRKPEGSGRCGLMVRDFLR